MISFLFFTDTATTEIYTLSHTTLFRSEMESGAFNVLTNGVVGCGMPTHLIIRVQPGNTGDRKSTRLNSSHTVISYAVFCLKKKKNKRWRCVSSEHSVLRARILCR